MSQRYTPKGNLSTGEAIYQGEKGDLAIEKDHRYLVEPSALERAMILGEHPDLLPERRISGHAVTDDHWLITCEGCGNIIETEGFFDPDDHYTCGRCGLKFKCCRIVFDDGSYIE